MQLILCFFLEEACCRYVARDHLHKMDNGLQVVQNMQSVLQTKEGCTHTAHF